MMQGVSSVVEAFDYLYKKLLDRDFRKTFDFHTYGERDLLPLVRTFLLGWFGDQVRAEVECKLPGANFGRLDFVIGGVAVEFAVRRPSGRRAALSRYVNATEVKKLLK